MHTVAVIPQKVGTGKTTLAVHLANDFEGDGGSAAVVDLDPQASAALWGDKRGRSPFVGAVPAVRLETALRAALPSGTGLAVHDYGSEVAPARIGARAAFAQCLPRGLSAAEAYPRSKAAGEIRALGAWLRQRLEDRNA